MWVQTALLSRYICNRQLSKASKQETNFKKLLCKNCEVFSQ